MRCWARMDGWKLSQVVVLVVVFLLGLYQFAEAGFDWRQLLERTSLLDFLLAASTLPVFGFPISACYIYAGVAFPIWQGVLVTWLALAVNMSVSYALTRTVLKAPLERFMRKRGWMPPDLSDQAEFRFTFLIRTVPGPPFFFQNLALGLAGVRFSTYLWVSLLAQGMIALAMIVLSHSVSEAPKSEWVFLLGAVCVSLAMAKAIQKLRNRYRAKQAGDGGGEVG